MSIAIIDPDWVGESTQAASQTGRVVFYTRENQWTQLVRTAESAWQRRIMSTDDLEAQERADLVAALDDEQAEIISSIGD